VSGHTPGPWTVVESSDKRQQGYIRCAHKFAPEAEECIAVARVTQRCFDRATTDANARLIAAAPDLLEALRRLADSISYDRDPAVEPYFREPLKAARAAIAKAEGSK
jgi:hypothetical protein